MKNNKQKQYKKPDWETPTHDIKEIDDITDEINATLHALRMQMAEGDPNDATIVAEVRGKLDNLVEKVAAHSNITGVDDKETLLMQIGRKLFSVPFKIPFNDK